MIPNSWANEILGLEGIGWRKLHQQYVGLGDAVQPGDERPVDDPGGQDFVEGLPVREDYIQGEQKWIGVLAAADNRQVSYFGHFQTPVC